MGKMDRYSKRISNVRDISDEDVGSDLGSNAIEMLGGSLNEDVGLTW